MRSADHSPAVSETQESARRWSGYVCPDCRFVFRVPRDHDGCGIVCPSCSRLLRMPGPDDVVPSLVASARRGRPMAEVSFTRSMHEQRKPAWERQSGQDRPTAVRRNWVFAGVAGGLALTGIALAVWLRPTDRPAGGSAAGTRQTATAPAVKPEAPAPVDAFARFQQEAAPVMKRFLQAKTPDEALRDLRRPEVAGPRLRRWYADGKIDPPGWSKLPANDSDVTFDGAFATAQVVTRDGEKRKLTLERTPDGWKVDWESWTGWSEMTWPDFLAERPTRPIRMRVVASPVEYYNFAFSDDAKWQSYRLVSPDNEHLVYGYVARGSELDLAMQFRDSDAPARLVLVDIRFPEGSPARNQVLVERLVANSWVEPADSARSP